MHAPGTLRDLLDAAETGTGEPTLGVPAEAPIDLRALLTEPLPFAVRVRGSWGVLSPTLHELARVRDPVADAHAGWLLAVLLAAQGGEPVHDRSLPPAPRARLTPEGRAWLIAQTLDAAPADEQRRAILAATERGT